MREYRKYGVQELEDIIKSKCIVSYSGKSKKELIEILVRKELWDREEERKFQEKMKRFDNMTQGDIDDYMNVVEDEIYDEEMEKKEIKKKYGLKRGKIYFMISIADFAKKGGEQVVVKIGSTTSKKNRLRTHQTSHADIQCWVAIIKTPLPEPGDPNGYPKNKLHKGVEKRLQDTMKERGRWIRGEFFRLSRDEIHSMAELEATLDYRLSVKHFYSP